MVALTDFQVESQRLAWKRLVRLRLNFVCKTNFTFGCILKLSVCLFHRGQPRSLLNYLLLFVSRINEYCRDIFLVKCHIESRHSLLVWLASQRVVDSNLDTYLKYRNLYVKFNFELTISFSVKENNREATTTHILAKQFNDVCDISNPPWDLEGKDQAICKTTGLCPTKSIYIDWIGDVSQTKLNFLMHVYFFVRYDTSVLCLSNTPRATLQPRWHLMRFRVRCPV